MDWYDVTAPGRMRAFMVEPNRLDNTLGELTGVKWDSCSVEAGYYMDTRTTAKLVLDDGNWDGRAWVRLVYETEEGQSEIGTYIVVDDPTDDSTGRSECQLSLNSVLFALSRRPAEVPWTIGQGATATRTLSKLLEWYGCDYSLRGLKEYTAAKAYTFERGKSVLSWLFAIANNTGNRVDVTGHGTVTVSERVSPASIPQAFTLDRSDPRGLVIGGVHRESDHLTTPGRVVVHHQTSDGKDIVAYADATGEASPSNRGYLVSIFQSVSDLSPETYSQALRLAKEKLSKQGTALTEWTVSVPYLPVWEGTGITFLPNDAAFAGARKCFVKSLSMTDLHLNRPTMQLTLKECASGDKGDE